MISWRCSGVTVATPLGISFSTSATYTLRAVGIGWLSQPVQRPWTTPRG
jgi:hypothetical protein